MADSNQVLITCTRCGRQAPFAEAVTRESAGHDEEVVLLVCPACGFQTVAYYDSAELEHLRLQLDFARRVAEMNPDEANVVSLGNARLRYDQAFKQLQHKYRGDER